MGANKYRSLIHKCIYLFGFILTLSGFMNYGLAKDVYCLKPETEVYIKSILPFDGQNGYSLDNALIKSNQVKLEISKPELTVVLKHPSMVKEAENVIKSKNFVMILDGENKDSKSLATFNSVADFIKQRDLSFNIWNSCKPEGYKPLKDRQNKKQAASEIAKQSDKGSDTAKPFTFSLKLLLSIMYGFVFILFLMLKIFWKRLEPLREALNKRALYHSYLQVGKHSVLPVIAVVFYICSVLVYFGSEIGMTSEMIGPLNFYAYSYLEDDTTTAEAKPADCSDGFFRQKLRPVYGFCDNNGRQYALFYNNYTPTTFYYPLRILGDWFPALIGQPLKLFILPLLLCSFLVFVRLFSRHTSLKPAILAMVLMTSFPGIVVYSTFFLFETLIMVLAVVIWYVLDRYNRSGKSIWFVAAFFMLGLSFHTKATAVLFLIPLIITFASVFGIRRVAFSTVIVAFFVSTLMPALFFWFQHIKDPHFKEFTAVFNKFTVEEEESLQEDKVEAGQKLEDDEIRDDTVFTRFATLSYAMLNGTPFAFDPHSFEMEAYFVLFLIIFAYIFTQAVRGARRKEKNLTKAFITLLMAITFPLYFLVYQNNVGSIPLYQILPFLCGVLAFAIIDAHKFIKSRINNEHARKSIFALLLLLLVLFAVYRWYDAIEDVNKNSPLFTYDDQQAVVDKLVEFKALKPITYNSFFAGVFEFLSRGKIEPVYANQMATENLSAKGWEKILDKTKDTQADFLFMKPCNTFVHSCRKQPHGAENFMQAVLNRNRKIIKQVKITDSKNRDAFILVRLAAE